MKNKKPIKVFLSNIKHSKAIEKLNESNPDVEFMKKAYHWDVIQTQRQKRRILTLSEKKKIYQHYKNVYL